MGERQFGADKTNRKLEKIVLCIFTVFSLAMSVSAALLGWSILAKEVIIAAVIISWAVSIKEYRDYQFRVKLIALMCWINFFIYAVYSRSFTSMLSTMMALIVLLSIFCVVEIVYMGVLFTTVLCLYHVFILHTYSFEAANDILRLVLHIAAAYVISLVVWITIRIRDATSEQLMENIRELEIVEKSKDDFMVNISHEIRTPINAVCGMSEALLQEDLPLDVRRDIVDIQTAGRNLLATVSNILDFSELESGKMELAEESYNITSTITDIINMALTFENGKHLEFIVDCDASLPSNLVGDEQKLRRIIMNLLENAMKFTKEGGVVLRIKARKEEYGINLMVSIRDSGIGMDQVEIERIFTGYGQLDSRRNREEGGVGLGLSIAQALVQRMGGFITVNSRPGVGTEFMFTIPQKVLDETPIVSVRNKGNLFAACYINMDKYNFPVVREGYEKSIRHMAEQFGIMFRICRNLPELKRRIEHENYSHIFISWEEYCEDKTFFEKISQNLTVVLILDYGQETQVGSNMLRIYKPFTVLSIAAIFNGQKILQSSEADADTKHYFIAPDAKVLVVDDNAMNLKVMARLLLPYQIKVSTAVSGEEALRKLDTMEYDCVFLDHMMPEMDGVETLHRMKALPEFPCKDTPVVVLTANAITGAKEAYLKEGFDDFLSKPIVPDKLETMIRKMLPEEMLQEGKPTAQPTAAETRIEELPMVEGLDWNYAWLHLPDMELLAYTVREFYDQIDPAAENLEQAYEQIADAVYLEQYRIQVHAMKSLAATIGIVTLSGVARVLESAAKDGKINIIVAMTDIFLEEWRSYRLRLQGIFGIGTEEKKEITDYSVIRALVEMVRISMQDMDIDRADALMKQLREYAYPEEIEQNVLKLSEAVTNLDPEETERLARLLSGQMSE